MEIPYRALVRDILGGSEEGCITGLEWSAIIGRSIMREQVCHGSQASLGTTPDDLLSWLLTQV